MSQYWFILTSLLLVVWLIICFSLHLRFFFLSSPFCGKWRGITAVWPWWRMLTGKDMSLSNLFDWWVLFGCQIEHVCLCISWKSARKRKHFIFASSESHVHSLENYRDLAADDEGVLPISESLLMTSNGHDLIQSIKSSLRVSPEVANSGREPGV